MTDILDCMELPEQGVRDALALMVNATMHFLEHPTSDLEAVADDNYSVSLDTIAGWIRS